MYRRLLPILGLPVDVFDTVTEKSSIEPEVPGDRIVFSPAEAVHDGRFVVSTSEGNLFRLTADGKEWEKVGTSTTRRIVHRLVPHGSGLHPVGGAVPALEEKATELGFVPLAPQRQCGGR